MVVLEIDPAQGVDFGLCVCEFVDECVDSIRVKLCEVLGGGFLYHRPVGGDLAWARPWEQSSLVYTPHLQRK